MPSPEMNPEKGEVKQREERRGKRDVHGGEDEGKRGGGGDMGRRRGTGGREGQRKGKRRNTMERNKDKGRTYERTWRDRE